MYNKMGCFSYKGGCGILLFPDPARKGLVKPRVKRNRKVWPANTNQFVGQQSDIVRDTFGEGPSLDSTLR